MPGKAERPPVFFVDRGQSAFLEEIAPVRPLAHRLAHVVRDQRIEVAELPATAERLVDRDQTRGDPTAGLRHLILLQEEEPLAVEHFWGMKLTISRKIHQRLGAGAYISPSMRVANAPNVGLLTYLRLRAVREKEIPFFETLAQANKIALFRLRPLDAQKWDEEFQQFKHFWNQEMHFAHLACHAHYENSDPTRSSIRLENEFCICLEDMEADEITINGNPLVILNACETGQLNPLYTSHFAGAFLQYGARGVVATECAVPDSFAADFTEQLYTHLLAGQPLGKSLLRTRQYFWQEHGNP